MNETYKITLADGAVIGDLKLNGNNYISKEAITPAIFTGNCSPVMITNELGDDEIHDNMELVQITEMNGEYWFVLRDLTEEELTRIKMEADIEYVAMMSGVDL